MVRIVHIPMLINTVMLVFKRVIQHKMSYHHIVTLFKKQNSRNSTYLSHDCSQYFFYCIDRTVPCGYTAGIQDLQIDTHSCGLGCPQQNVCLRPDRDEASIGLSRSGLDPLVSLTWDLKPPALKCVYDVNRIDTLSQINKLRNLFPEDQVNHIMGEFCSLQSTSCPSGRKLCSLLTSIGEPGEICRDWLSKLPSASIRDAVRKEYCIYEDTDDCKCINRTKHAEYNDLKTGVDPNTLLAAKCWYKPCEDGDNLLLESEQASACSPNICQNIINAHAKGNINIRDNESSISCSFTPDQLKEADASRRMTTVIPFSASTSSTLSAIIGDYKYAFGAGAVVLVVVILVLIYIRRTIK